MRKWFTVEATVIIMCWGSCVQFEFTEEQKMIRTMADEFARDHGGSERIRAAMASSLGYDTETWLSLGELGLAGLLIGPDQGGQGLGPVEMALVHEALGRYLISGPMLASGVIAATFLAGLKSQELTLMQSMASGELRVALARFADGQSLFVLDAHHADCLLACVDDAAYIVYRNEAGEFPGIAVERLTMLDQTRVLSHLNMVELTPDAQKLSEGREVTQAYQDGLAMGRLATAAEAVGAAQTCLMRTVEYAQEREQFGRKIGSFQALKHELANVMVNTEAAISAVYFAACTAAESPDALDQMAALARVQASEALTHAAGRMIQLHGGIGFTWEHDAHLYFKRARGTATLFGSNASLDEAIAASILGDAA